MTPLDRLPPHDVEAEEAVIAACMVAEDATMQVFPFVEPKDFYREVNGWIFAVCLDLWLRDEPVNQITVAHELGRRGQLSEIGGQETLSDSIRRLPTPIGCEYYAKIVKRDSTYRDLIRASAAMMQLAYAGAPDQQAVLDQCGDLLASVHAPDRGRPDVQTAAEIVDGGLRTALYDRFDNTQAAMGISTGIAQLDTVINGLRPGAVVYIAAQTSIGKSLFIQCLLLAIAQQERRSIVFTTEMDAQSVAERQAHMLARIDPFGPRRRGHYTESEQRRVHSALDTLAMMPIEYCDRADLTIEYIRARVKHRLAKGPLACIGIDHLHQVSTAQRYANRSAELSVITREIKNMARATNACVVVPAQMNRTSSYGDINARLKDSGSIEQDGDVVMFLTPVGEDDGKELTADAARQRAGREGWTKFELFISKNRGGITGHVDLACDYRIGGQYLAWEDFRV